MTTALFLLTALLAAEPHKAVEPRVPKLNSVFPQGAQPGAKLRVEVLGEYLDRAQTVVFLDPGSSRRCRSKAPTRASRSISRLAPALRSARTTSALSRRAVLRIFCCSASAISRTFWRRNRTQLSNRRRKSRLPATINGRLNVDGDFDFFRFHVDKGQSWIFDLGAARNGNGLDAALILLDAKGRKLSHSEDVFIWDPFIQYTFAEAGDYYAVVQPTHRHNDPNFAYQLDIRTAPHLETISPISIRPGATVEATIFGAGLTGSGQAMVRSAGIFRRRARDARRDGAREDPLPRRMRAKARLQLAIVTPGGRSNPATLLIDRDSRLLRRR